MEAEPQPQETRAKRRRGGMRKKTGCFTCKARHTRCDEKKPVCSNCERLGIQCRASEFITRSAWCPTDKDQLKRRESLTSGQDMSLADPQSLSPPISTRDIFHSSLPELHNSSSDSAPASSESPSTLLTPERVYLLNEFRHGLATWMDVFDHSCTYQREVCRRALTSELLLRCICAFTARQLCLLAAGKIWTSVATQYYSQSLNLLIKQLNSPEPRDDALSAVMLLSSYEVLADQGQEHHRHYEGGMKLMRMQGISARSIGLDKANFWIWVRHEIIVAIVNETPLQMGPKYWDVNWREGETEEDMLGNQILWLVGRAVDWVYGNGSPPEYHDLLSDAERWYAGLSVSFRGINYGEPVEDGLSKVHFAVPAAAAAMLWYHVLYILLYAEPVLQDATYALKVQEHATKIISISISDIPNQARCFSIIPLYFAGKHVDSIVRKTRVLVLLENIQTELGYHTRTRVEALQRLLERTSRKEWYEVESSTLPQEQL